VGEGLNVRLLRHWVMFILMNLCMPVKPGGGFPAPHFLAPARGTRLENESVNTSDRTPVDILQPLEHVNETHSALILKDNGALEAQHNIVARDRYPLMTSGCARINLLKRSVLLKSLDMLQHFGR
jgi:hypothetical protein